MPNPDPSDIIPFPAHETTLANGLRVIVVPTGFPNLVSIHIPVQTGSRNEVEPGKSGFAHFFEHLMFRGTPTTPPEKYQDIMTQAGAREQRQHHATTTRNYHSTFAKEDLETVLDLEADRFQNLKYSEADFKTEARAVLGEYNKNAADPLEKLFEVQRDHAYTSPHLQAHDDGLHCRHRGHAEPVRVLEDVLRPLVPAAVHDRHHRRRREPAATLPLVEKYWGAWEAGEHPEVVIPQEPPQGAPVVAHVPWPTATLPWMTRRLPRPGVLGDGQRVRSDGRAPRPALWRDVGPLPAPRGTRAESRPVLPVCAVEQSTRGCSTLFARVKKLEDMAYVRDADHGDGCVGEG